MGLPGLLQKISLLSLLAAYSYCTEALRNISLARPGCKSKCQDIDIPFPFGVETNCYLNKSYYVQCYSDSGKPRVKYLDADLADISLDGHLRVFSPVARACYNKTSKVISKEPQVRLGIFPMSVSQNKITTIGCGALGYMKTNKSYVTKCSTLSGQCHPTIGQCSNVSCCQSTIEREQLTDIHLLVKGGRRKAGKEGYANCSYSFVLGDNGFDISKLRVFDELQKSNSFKMVLDWQVGDTDCQEAQRNKSTYLCRENSECHDAQNGPGYRCSCSTGYYGNPYLENGCQDIDECEDPSLNDCTNLCTNTLGSYNCSCPKGRHGDGRNDGEGCVANQPSLQKLGIYMGTSVGAMVTFFAMAFVYLLVKQRRAVKCRERYFEQNGGMIFQKLLSEYKESAEMVKIYTEKELKKATNNFDPKNILGQGGHGTVYKGRLADTTMVAIKKSKVIDLRQIKQFVNEMLLLSQINHPNVVKLLGCCLETNVPLLVYEFITNKTLFDHLHEKRHGSSITWGMRLNIAAETAEALAYMHSKTQIIHRDIKTSNILLNDDYTAKVSDFGISRFVPMDKTHLSTKVQGTVGYIDPEYFYSGVLTEKSDVYSFGVVLVELITGEKVHSFDRTESKASLAEYFVSALIEDQLNDILDDQVKTDCSLEQLNRVSEVAKMCLNKKGKSRPTMKEVAQELANVRTSQLQERMLIA